VAPTHAVASPAIGRRLRPVQFAPSSLEFRWRSFSGMAANGNKRVRTVQDSGFLLCAPRLFRDIAHGVTGFSRASAWEFSVASCRHIRLGVGVWISEFRMSRMFSDVSVFFWSSEFLRHVLSWGVCRVNIIPTGRSALDRKVLGGVSSGRVTAARLMLAPSHWAISSDLNRRDSVPMCAGKWQLASPVRWGSCHCL
jgi:hypothetical protein